VSATIQIVARQAELPRYAAAMRWLHWLTAALILVMFVLGIWIRYFEPKDAAFSHRLYNLHESTGLTIWLLVLARIAVRLATGAPPLPVDTPMAVRVLATLNHLALYAVLLTQPILGLMDANSWGVRIVWYEAVPVPTLIAKQPEAIANSYSDAHWWGAATLLLLLLFHIAGAAYHGLLRRDGVVRHMA
jgi:cytochrome b561